MTVAAVSREAELLAAYQAGETGAFEEVYDRHAQQVLTYVVGMIGDRDAAEEVIQQVFTKFAVRARKIPPTTADTAISNKPKAAALYPVDISMESACIAWFHGPIISKRIGFP